MPIRSGRKHRRAGRPACWELLWGCAKQRHVLVAGRIWSKLKALLLAAVLCGLGSVVPAQEGTAESRDLVLVVPITGEIQIASVALVRRALSEASSRGASRVVLLIDTPGGQLAAMHDITALLSVMRRDPAMRTVAYVQNQAYSAGAYLALACDQLFMMPASKLGAITPILGGPGFVGELPPDIRDKTVSALRGSLRGLIEERENSRPDLGIVAEAMVDPDLRVFEVTYADAGGFQQTQIVDEQGVRRIESSGNRILRSDPLGSDKPPLVLTAQEAAKIGLSNGSISSLEELVRTEFHLTMDSVIQLQATWSEDAVRWLDRIKPFLFVIGFLLLIIEFKTPGFAIPGVLGALLLGVAMFSSYLVGLAEWTEILLFFAGIGLIAVEIFVMPGTLIFGFLGFLALVFGLITSQQTFILPGNDIESDILLTNLLNMTWLILLVVAGAILFGRMLPYIPVLNRVLLTPPDPAGFRAAGTPSGGLVDLARWIGREGATVTDLRPAGIAEVDGERLDAVAEGGFLARGTPVRVIAARLNQVVVAPQQDPQRGEVAFGFLVLLLIVGLALTLAEVFFVSMGILGTLAAVSLVTSVFLAFTQHGQVTGFAFLTIAAVGAPLIVLYGMKWLPNTRLGRLLILSGPTAAEVSGSGADPALAQLLGQTGTAESDLRPAGFARIGGRRIDVVTRGEMLELGTEVRVVDVSANRVVVARHAAAPAQTINPNQ